MRGLIATKSPAVELELVTVFTRFVTASQPVPTNLLEGPGGKVYATLFRCVNLYCSSVLSCARTSATCC